MRYFNVIKIEKYLRPIKEKNGSTMSLFEVIFIIFYKHAY